MTSGFLTIFRMDLVYHWRRPLTWVLLVLLGFLTFGLSSGNVALVSGDSTVGGDSKAWITSEFAVAQLFPLVTFLFYVFFISIASGMAIPRDDELNVGPILHSTLLRPRSYAAAKFSAALVTFFGILTIHLLLQMFFNHLWPNAEADKFRGPFEMVNYVRPAVVFALPCLTFFCGAAFAIGTLTRKPILIFVMPTAFFMVSVFFLFGWSPTWLAPEINRWLMMIEPSGFRWVNETWLKLDRGVDFYNHESIPYDGWFLASRFIYALLGVGLAMFAGLRFERTLRGVTVRSKKLVEPTSTGEIAPAPRVASLASLAMTARVPSFLQTVWSVARFELRALMVQPGLYLFVPIILVQVVGNGLFNVGAFDTPILWTSGTAAVQSVNALTLMVAFLIMFYMVESVLRERNTRLAPMFYATPTRTGALLFGKALANGFIGAIVLLGAFLGTVTVLLWQGEVAVEIGPFVLVWGLLIVPTFLLWASYVAAVLALTGNRYFTYAIALGTLAFTGWKQAQGEMNWVGNWDLWSVLTWTDFGNVDPNGMALVLNRLFYFAVMIFLVTMAVRTFPRREHDSGRILDRMRPGNLARSALRLSPVVVPAIALGVMLHVRVGEGFQGKSVENRDEDYWGRNLATWVDADTPEIGGVEVDVSLDPPNRSFKVSGTYALVNMTDEPMTRFPMSVGDHFEDVQWTLNGDEFEADDRAGLHVFDLDTPLAPGDTARVGFSHHGSYPNGFTKNGSGTSEFILPSGVVLTSFTTSFVPVPYFEDGRGVDEDNTMEPKDFEEGHFHGVTPPAFGSGARYDVRTKISGPDDYRYHGVGIKTSEVVEDGQRTVVWESDFPVNFFNVVAGRWDVWEGDGVEIYHHPKHVYNIEEMGEALEASRKYYSEWFYPYPWQDLRLNEFAGIASYAQGFPTNITFSESIGFLTRSTKESNAVFLVTAHEAAHQWWGNILMPGEGPGGNVLSEGMAHFSTILLFDQIRGEEERIEFCERIEENYGDERQVDAEKPLVWIDGSKAGDTTVTYDKGGWVFWMLHNLLGEEASFAGTRQFIEHYSSSQDFPVLQDYVRVMRDFAADPEAFDEFVEQWFFTVVAPRYQLTEAEKVSGESGWVAKVRVENVGSGRMPLEVVATRGVRFSDSEDEVWESATRVVVLGPGESREVEIPCDFEPERVIVDPDARVLMLEREAALASL